MPTIELPQGAVRYRVAGEQASGPPVVFVHGFLVNATLWVKTADALAAAGVRSYAPDWPLGAHARTGGWRRPIPARSRPSGTQLHRGARARRRDAGGQRHRRRDLPVPAGHRRVAHRPTRTDQLRRLRQLPSTTFDLLFKAFQSTGAIRGLMVPMRAAAVRHSPAGFGLLVNEPLDARQTRAWVEPCLTDAGVREDVARFARAVDPQDLLAASNRLGRFDRPRFAGLGNRGPVLQARLRATAARCPRRRASDRDRRGADVHPPR